MFFLQAEVPQASIIQLIMPFVIMLGAFYFFLIRPQQKQQKQRQTMLDALKKGDKVLTVGGILGEIVALKDNYVTLKIADKVEIKVTRSGIGSVTK